jgi:hypothetical protein
MPFGTGDDIKSGVVYEWLRGSSRDKIAGIYSISSGGVTNIINEWRNNIGAYIAEDLRELSTSLKKANITPIQCSTGFRVAKVMQRLGITEDQFESFMSDIYDRCQKLELGPDQIEKYLTETINISKIVFPSQIPNYINTKKIEIENLHTQIENLHQKISTSNIQKTIIEKKMNSLRDNNNISREVISWYKNIKQAFQDAEIPIDNVSRFMRCLEVMKNQGYDVNKILGKFTEYEKAEDLLNFQQETKDIHQSKVDELLRQTKSLREQLKLDQLKLSELEQLKNMGIGIKELKTLYNKITEIATEKNIPSKTAMEKLLDDLKDYEYLLGFKNKIEILKQESSSLNREIERQRMIISSQPYIGATLQTLLGMGISEHDIIEINSILLSIGVNDYDDYDYDHHNKIILNKKALKSDLTNYRTLKLALRDYELKQNKLSKEITTLENQKENLQYYINFLILMMVYLFRDLELSIKKVDIALKDPKNLKIILIIWLLHSSVLKDDNNPPEENHEREKEQNQDEDEEDKNKSKL